MVGAAGLTIVTSCDYIGLISMRTAGLRELKAKLAEYIRDVRRGETVLVTDRGQVVAEINPPGARVATPAPGGLAPRLVALAAEGRVHLPTATSVQVQKLREQLQRFRPVPSPGLSQQMLDQERGER
jgi:antitoxin (DNA-binding transcriptional repressor) of toxin-antitoxin stability system